MSTELKRFYRTVSPTRETCFYVECDGPLPKEEIELLRWLLGETFEPSGLTERPYLDQGNPRLVEIGPRLSFATAFSTNAVGICRACGLDRVTRLERSRRLLVPDGQGISAWTAANHDRMVECVYPDPLASLTQASRPRPVRVIPLLAEGPEALRRINREMGLGMDDWDIGFYHDLFAKTIGRDPTDVECFQLGQANSEHSRHWFFQGKLVQGGQELPETLLEIIKRPWKDNPGNSLIAFSDNASAIVGGSVSVLRAERPGQLGPLEFGFQKLHPTFNAETHNFPSGVAPFPGAETGTGGRIRDGQAVGRGGLVIAGTVGYCVGSLCLPDYSIPGETAGWTYPDNLASPLEILIGESNGASDYGNKFGEPVIQGHVRTFGQRLPGGERREWVKPILFSGGVGQIGQLHLKKDPPAAGMVIVQVGGPAYRIGMGGGAASSMIQGDNAAELDFNAVQRGDAEMEQKMNRVIRACIEMAGQNPIRSIHDQGAGGPCNVLTELVAPAGGRVDIRQIRLGDASLSVLEIWGAEYQERNALLIGADRLSEFQEICARERVHCEVLGEITGDGRITVEDSRDGSRPVDLDLGQILCDMPQKTFVIDEELQQLQPLDYSALVTPVEALHRVLALPPVGSKGYLVRKVDRSVTGLVARQQCCGPLQLPVSDVAVVAQSHQGLTGIATAVGEQPIKMLIDPAAGARMALTEALTNLCLAGITSLEDVRCSINWMWAAKLPGEGAKLHRAAEAVSRMMSELGMACDGGKDSLSMAAKVDGETVKAPGQMVVSAYAPMADLCRVLTPDLKRPGKSHLIHIDLSDGKRRLGGSALAQSFGQVGDETPDLEDSRRLASLFQAMSDLLSDARVLSGHDISDGGLAVCLTEMAIAGNCGLEIELPAGSEPMAELFAEEPGVVLEVAGQEPDTVLMRYLELRYGLTCRAIGRTTGLLSAVVIVDGNGRTYRADLPNLLLNWEATSDRLEREQMNPALAHEQALAHVRSGPTYSLSFRPETTLGVRFRRHQVAVIREEGSNGDREMAAAFHQGGFVPLDVTMTDLLDDPGILDDCRGVAFVGGFSYADTLGSAKGWAGTIRFNERLRRAFERFRARPDTFSLGVCNGCQLMALIGWVPWYGLSAERQPRFIANRSERFESRWSTVLVKPSPAIMLKGMAGSRLGIWVAHGEGRLHCPDPAVLKTVRDSQLTPLVYVDDRGCPAEDYPFNPNGSPGGITALCSPDGRHLAMMPHPERAFLKWQWPWMPEEWHRDLEASPWLRLFQNAREWCDRHGQ